MRGLAMPALREQARREPGAPARQDRMLSWLRSRWRRLDFNDRAALGLWAGAHVVLVVLAWMAGYVFRSGQNVPFHAAFEHWDVIWYRNIAAHGYFSGQSSPHSIAFFPGFPGVLAAAHLVVRNWVLTELLVPAVAGCFAVVSLVRLAGDRRVVLYLLTMPAAVFLLVGYTESLFLALAVPAWRAGRRDQWLRAMLLAGLAGLVRPNGVFLILALAVMALTTPGRQRIVNAVMALLALAGPAAYEIYIAGCTGQWNAWSRAMQAGWDLHLTTPVKAFKASWQAAFHNSTGSWAIEAQLEFVVVAVIVSATVAFLWRRRWPEAVYCGLAAVSLCTQTWYSTSPRTLLVLFPVYLALTRLGAGRRPWVMNAYLAVCAPVAAVFGLLYLAYQWAG